MKNTNFLKWTLNGITLSSLSAFSFAIQAQEMYSPEGIVGELEALTGCFQVDYSYSETKSLQEGYQVDSRVYDATRKMDVMEYISPLSNADGSKTFQHFLFWADPTTQKVIFKMKHHGERWSRSFDKVHQYQGDSKWQAKDPVASSEQNYLKSVTSLDDGPRYQCESAWKTFENGKKTWSCTTYAPIPGRETRDMGRNDYQGLQRTTKISIHPWGYLERQDNIKIIEDGETRTELAQEAGKVFYLKMPMERCAEVKEWANQRDAYWSLSRLVWQEYRDQHETLWFNTKLGGKPRHAHLKAIEEEYFDRISYSPTAMKVKQLIHDTIVKFEK